MILSARQFASKYPGKLIKLTVKAAAAFAVKQDEVIGTVVGFRTGTKGVVGSSKVAIYPGLYGYNKGTLEVKTNRDYESVVPDAPSARKGIYFLSVSDLDLPELPKPIVTYPDTCARLRSDGSRCGFPCRNGKKLAVCSNSHCKTNSITFKALGPFPKILVVNKEGFVLCPDCQTDQIDLGNSDRSKLSCRNPKRRHSFRHVWKDGQKINYNGTRYIYKNKDFKRL